MPGGGWTAVEAKDNRKSKLQQARREHKAETATHAPVGGDQFQTATGAFAELEALKARQENERRNRKENEAESRRLRQAAAEKRKNEDSDLMRKREIAERQRRAKDPRSWPALPQVLQESHEELMNEISDLLDDELANSSESLHIQYVFGTLDKFCRHTAIPRAGPRDVYLEPLSCVKASSKAWDILEDVIETHFPSGTDEAPNTNPAGGASIIEIITSTFGGNGTIVFSSNSPSGNGVLLCMQQMLSQARGELLNEFAGILSVVFLDAEGKFRSKNAFTNACIVLAQAYRPELRTVNNGAAHCRALTAFFAGCDSGDYSPPTALLDLIASSLSQHPRYDYSNPATDVPHERSSMALQQLLAFVADDNQAAISTLIPLLLQGSKEMSKGAKVSLLFALKLVRSELRAQAALALRLCEDFVAAETGVQVVWAERIATQISDSIIVLKALKAKGVPLHPLFASRAMSRLRGALDKPGALDEHRAAASLIQTMKVSEQRVTIHRQGNLSTLSQVADPAASGNTETSSAAHADEKPQSAALRMLGLVLGLAVIASAYYAALPKSK